MTEPLLSVRNLKIAYRVGGRDVLKLSPRDLRKLRGKEIAYVFQEPATSLNPVLTVRTQMAEALL